MREINHIYILVVFVHSLTKAVFSSIVALANRQGAGGMADAGTERNGDGNGNPNPNPLDDPNIHGGNIGGVYQEGLAPAEAAAAAAQNRLIENAVNAENDNIARSNRIAFRREEEGIRRSAGNWQSGMQQIKWLRRLYVRPMQYSRLQMLRNTVYVAGQQEMEHYRRELRRKPIMISTSSPSSSSVSRGIQHVRGRRIPTGRTRSSNALPSNGNQANNRSTYRTRAVREREQQDIEEDEDDDHSATSVSSDSSDGTLVEDQLSSSSDTSDSQSSVYSDWVNPVCI